MSDTIPHAKATVKFSTTREENPKGSKNALILPYAFSSESMGFTVGAGGATKEYGQDQLLIGGTVFGSGEGAAGTVLEMWDYKMPWVNRLFFSALGSIVLSKAAELPTNTTFPSFFQTGKPMLVLDLDRFFAGDMKKDADGNDRYTFPYRLRYLFKPVVHN